MTGFPLLSLAGQFLLQDLVLLAVAATIVARDATSDTTEHKVRVMEERAA